MSVSDSTGGADRLGQEAAAFLATQAAHRAIGAAQDAWETVSEILDPLGFKCAGLGPELEVTRDDLTRALDALREAETAAWRAIGEMPIFEGRA